MRPRLLDLFCGAGGAAVGYHRAGFDVVGVDIARQKNYPFEFIQADAMEFPLDGYDAIHASPPCQGYSIMNNLPWNRARDYPLLLLATRERLVAAGVPYVMENVGGARYGAKGLEKRGLQEHGMQAGFLCGLMFGLPMYRHRYFESNWFWMQPGHPKHRLNAHPRSERFVYGGTRKGLPGGAAGLDVKPRIENPVNSGWQLSHNGSPNRNGAQAYGNGIGHSAGWRRAAEMMGIDWMKREELTQAIPPVFTEYVGRELLRCLGDSGVVLSRQTEGERTMSAKVYLVTAGEYSDYRIVAAFSLKESAEAFRDTYNGNKGYRYDEANVEDLEVDVPPERWVSVEVWMDVNGNQTREPEVEVGTEFERGDIWFTPNGQLLSRVQTGDVQTAIKVTNERRVRLLAEGKWGRNESKEHIAGSEELGS